MRSLGRVAALDATFFPGGRPTVDGEKGPQPRNVRLALTAQRCP